MVGTLFKLFIRLSCHSPIKLGILGEAVDERHEAAASFLADKSEHRMSSFGARAASVLMLGTRSGGLVLIGFNAWPPWEQRKRQSLKISPSR